MCISNGMEKPAVDRRIRLITLKAFDPSHPHFYPVVVSYFVQCANTHLTISTNLFLEEDLEKLIGSHKKFPKCGSYSSC